MPNALHTKKKKKRKSQRVSSPVEMTVQLGVDYYNEFYIINYSFWP